MAGLFNEILAGRFNRGLQKLFQLKADAPAPQLAPEISFQIIRISPAEEDVLFSLHGYCASERQVAVVGQQSHMMLRNPATSGVVAAVQYIAFTTDIADTIRAAVILSNTNFATITISARLDSRSRSSALTWSKEASAGLLGVGLAWRVAANAMTIGFASDRGSAITLVPGAALIVESGTANTNLDATVLWRERAIEESELAGLPITSLP